MESTYATSDFIYRASNGPSDTPSLVTPLAAPVATSVSISAPVSAPTPVASIQPTTTESSKSPPSTTNNGTSKSPPSQAVFQPPVKDIGTLKSPTNSFTDAAPLAADTVVR